MKIIVMALAILLASSLPVEASGWRGPIRLSWYHEPGTSLGCPGAGSYKRWKRVVAVRPSDTRFRCGDRVELRYFNQTVVATVADHFSESAPSWVVFDASAIINCRLLMPRYKRPPKKNAFIDNCSTLDKVYWRKLN